MSSPTTEKTWVPLTPGERRVLGVLVEKAKTTPENYPLSLNALVNGCNQKSNRDPITNYDEDDVEGVLENLRRKGATVRIEGTGRVVRWKHTLYEWLELKNQPVEMAVVTELLLRGPQTEGDLRARASRMEPIADLPALQTVLEGLIGRSLVVRLSPPGQLRGVVVTHGLYPPEEFEKIRKLHAAGTYEQRSTHAEPAQGGGHASSSSSWAVEASAIRAELEALKQVVEAVAADLRNLKETLGG
jgi:uncharacterized protein